MSFVAHQVGLEKVNPSLDLPVAASVEWPEEVFAEMADRPPKRRPKSWPVKVWYGLCYTLEWLFGLASLIACLAVLAAIPIVNFVSLGFLLEASGRVARSGRVRDGLIDIGKFARIGSMVAGTWICLLVPRLVSSLASDAQLIDPEGSAARAWRMALVVCTVLVVCHLLLAWYSGGRLRHFFWPVLAPFQWGARLLLGRIIGPVARPLITAVSPGLAEDLYARRPLSAWFPPAILAAGIRRGHIFAETRDAVWDFAVSLRLAQHFWMGVRGFVGALAWLVVPSVMLMTGTSGKGPATVLIGYGGAIAMAWVVLHLPFLQAHFAFRNRLSAMFELGEVRRQFRRAPVAYWLALVVSLLFALPLYLLKIEPPPRELWWTLTIFFIVFIYPARLLTGWAVGRALKRELPRPLVFRWLARGAAIPIVLLYVFILFFTQYTSFLGPASILEQHAFLLPVPFLAL